MEVGIYKMIYKKQDNSDNSRILGEEFVKNNNNKAKLVINNRKYSLNIIHNIAQNKIKIILKQKIHNISFMFKNCNLLESFSKLSNDDNIDYINISEKINNDSEIDEKKTKNEENDLCKESNSDDNITSFYPSIKNQHSLISEISKIVEKNLNYSEISNLCNEFNSKTDNLTLLNGLFSNCESLVSLSNISIWKANCFSDMSYLFYNCKSLLSLPDISNLNTNNVNNMSHMFSNCEKLEYLSDISNWKLNNVKNISYMFSNCKSLISLPDISKWRINDIFYLNDLFSGCKSLVGIPNISNWNTKNINNIGHLFYNCESLLSMPDISKWNIANVKNMKICFSIVSIYQFYAIYHFWTLRMSLI